MQQTNVTFPPYPLLAGQEAFVTSLAFEKAYVGGFGAGKSVALCVLAILLAHQQPGNRILICRKTYKSLNETTRNTFAELLPPELNAGEKRSEDEQYIHCAGGGRSTILWRSFEDSPADWEKFRSSEYGACLIDEASEAPRKLCEILIGRLRTKVNYRCMAYASNPTPKAHWLYDYFLGGQAVPGQRELFRGTTYENRTNLPAGYIENMERSYTKEMVDILLKGEFGHIPQGLPVFPEFRRMNEGQIWHVRPGLEPIKNVPILRGWDFGVVRPAVIWAQFTDRKRFLREKLGYNTATPKFGRLVRDLSGEMFPGFKFVDYCDPQGFARGEETGTSCVDELSKLHIHPVHIKKTGANFRAGVISEILKRTIQTDSGVEPEFQIDSDMEVTIGALAGGYRRAEPMVDHEVDDEPVKDGYYEHPIDALGFLVYGRTHGGNTDRARGGERTIAQKKRACSYGGNENQGYKSGRGGLGVRVREGV